jgi:hypothetical protein
MELWYLAFMIIFIASTIVISITYYKIITSTITWKGALFALAFLESVIIAYHIAVSWLRVLVK